jgi:O-methyltransferase
MSLPRSLLQKGLGLLGYRLVPTAEPAPEPPPPELDAFDLETLEAARPFTMTSRARLIALVKAVHYLVEAEIPGDVVECGVWKGGSMLAAARTLARRGDAARALHLFDTFEGMPPPADIDRDAGGRAARELLARGAPDSHIVARSPLDEVRATMARSGHDPARIRFVQGKVEDTLPGAAPERIALLRLDTDWFESTYHELVHLYPRLSPGGVLIIDDYGYWQGARAAVDRYVREQRARLLLHVIDDTGRIAVKPGLAAR